MLVRNIEIHLDGEWVAPHLDALEETLRACGVDREVIEIRKRPIEDQARRLAQLGREGAKHGG